MVYQERFYRYYSRPKCSLEISYRESDLYIISDKPLAKEKTKEILIKYYCQIEEYIKKNPSFFTSLSPLALDENAPLIVQDMVKASCLAAIGPFSAVAGAVAFYLGKELLNYCRELIIENGGDIFMKINGTKRIGLYLGENFTPKALTIKVKKEKLPFGICSSSAKIGPSLNFGKADLLTVKAKDSIVADSFATAYANRIKKVKDIAGIFKQAQTNFLIDAIVIVFEGKLYFWGDIELE
ncbi:MAG: UPF0280 family protein [Candidatus Omnitrophota bacterium]